MLGSFPLDKFRWVRGRPKMYQSSKIARRGFCARRGTPLVFRNLYSDNRIGISIGSLDHPEKAPPEIHWGVESMVPFLKIEDDLPRKHTMEDPSVAEAWARVKKRARLKKRGPR
jgi:adenylate cyclase